RADEGWSADAVARGAEELRELEHRGGADDRRREQEGEPGRVFVREPDEKAAGHRRPRAREAGDERDRLSGADGERLAEAHPPRDPSVGIARLGLRSAPP